MLGPPDQSRTCQSERTCIVTRTKGAPESLLRFVLRAGRRRRAGFAAQIARPRRLGDGATPTTVAKAVKRKAFARGFKAEVRVAESLAAMSPT